jgi:aryl-alcohol dehydrogenase-like predicted oxidoreductase
MSNDSFPLDHYRLLGQSGLRVSPLCLGTMTFGTAWGWGADKDESRRQFELYLSLGGNFIDTACNYTNGESEQFVGEFAEGRRDRLVIATKYTLSRDHSDPNAGGNHRKNMRNTVESSLRRLRTDYIDILYLHMWEYRVPIEEILRAADDLVRQGKVLHFAFSDTPAYKIAEAATIARFRGYGAPVALQHQYSLVQRTVEYELNEAARDLGIGLCPWGVLAGGILTGKYHSGAQEAGSRAQAWQLGLSERDKPIADATIAIAGEIGRSPAQVAINWALCQPGVTSPILGARTAPQLEDNLRAAEFRLGDDQLARLNVVSQPQLAFPYDFLRGPGVKMYNDGQTEVEKHFP